MGFGIGLLEETNPQLLIVCAAESKSGLSGMLRSIWVGNAGKLIVDDDCSPEAIKEEAQLVATNAGGCGVDKQTSNEVVSLRNNGKSTQEPAVANSALQKIVWVKSKVGNDDVVGQALPHVGAGDGGAIGPRKELAASSFAVVIRAPLVAIGVALDDGFCGEKTASACDARCGDSVFRGTSGAVDAVGAGGKRGVGPWDSSAHGCCMHLMYK